MSGNTGAETIMRGHIDPFAAEMKKMINNKDMSDIKFLIGPNRKAIYGHRVLLSARCDVFRAMFLDQAAQQSVDKEIPFVLSDITPDIFLAVMEFIYTNCVTLSSKNAIDILGSSIEFGLEELRKLCNQYSIENLSINNACDVMQAAVTFQQDDLREKTLRYIQENTAALSSLEPSHICRGHRFKECKELENKPVIQTRQQFQIYMSQIALFITGETIWSTPQFLQALLTFSQLQQYLESLSANRLNDILIIEPKGGDPKTSSVFKTKGFHEMTDEAMSVVLQSDHLQIDEVEIIDAVREWATVNSVVLGKPINEIAKRVVEHIRLPLLSPEELKEVDEECQKDRLIAVEHISYAWRCHALKKSFPNSPLTWPRAGTKQREHHRLFKQQ